MLQVTSRLQIVTYAFVSAASQARVDEPRLLESTCLRNSFDDIQLMQKFILQDVDPQHDNIGVVMASKTVQLSMDGQIMASVQPVLTRAQWPENCVRVFAVQDRTLAVLIVGVTTLAVLTLLCFRIPLPIAGPRRKKAVEFLGMEKAEVLQTSLLQRPNLPVEVTQWNWDNATWQGCWAEAMLHNQAQSAPSALPDLPTPAPRLSNIGASYVVPFGCMRNATGTTLSFDIPTLPAVWPLRAVLTRATPQSAWTQIDLTVDIIAAAELPPLLSCTVCSHSGEAHQQCSEMTGGTGGTTTPGSQSNDDIVPFSQWLAIRNSGGATLASLMPNETDSTKYVLQRHNHDRVPWEINVHLEAEEPWVSVSRLGQDIGQAASLRHRMSLPPTCEDSDTSDLEEEMQQHLQIDTQPETQTPESLLLLMCFLAMISFQPAKSPEKL